MDEWMNCSNIKENPLQEIKNFFEGTNYFKFLCKYLYLNSTDKDKLKIDKIVEQNKKEYEKISNKPKYFEEISEKKLKIVKEVEKIDFLLSNKEKLMKKYISTNLKLEKNKKFSTINSYKKYLCLKREEQLAEIVKLGNLMKPANFIKYKNDLEETLEFTEVQDISKIIENMQIEFVKKMQEVTEEIESSEEIINYLFKVRYYKNLYINEKLTINSIEKKLKLDNVQRTLIEKACNFEKPILKNIVSNKNLNFEIIKNILDTKIMDLQEIRFEVTLKESRLVIKVYENEVYEKDFEVNFEGTKKDILVKQNKIIKLF